MQDVSAHSHVLVPYHAKQLSLAAQALRRRLEASKQVALPKKAFAFSRKAPQKKLEAGNSSQLERLGPAQGSAESNLHPPILPDTESKAEAGSHTAPER